MAHQTCALKLTKKPITSHLHRRAQGMVLSKRMATPDMRYAANKTPSPKTPSPGNASTPVKRDGTPDMRFAVNWPSRGPASTQTRSSFSYTGPLKKDGTPDMRYAKNKQSVGFSSFSSSYEASLKSPAVILQYSKWSTEEGWDPRHAICCKQIPIW